VYSRGKGAANRGRRRRASARLSWTRSSTPRAIVHLCGGPRGCRLRRPLV